MQMAEKILMFSSDNVCLAMTLWKHGAINLNFFEGYLNMASRVSSDTQFDIHTYVT